MADDADVDGFVNVAQLEEYVGAPEAANDDELQEIAAGLPMAQLVAEDLVGAALAKLGRGQELLTHKEAYVLLRARDSDRVRRNIPTKHEYKVSTEGEYFFYVNSKKRKEADGDGIAVSCGGGETIKGKHQREFFHDNGYAALKASGYITADGLKKDPSLVELKQRMKIARFVLVQLSMSPEGAVRVTREQVNAWWAGHEVPFTPARTKAWNTADKEEAKFAEYPFF